MKWLANGPLRVKRMSRRFCVLVCIVGGLFLISSAGTYCYSPGYPHYLASAESVFESQITTKYVNQCENEAEHNDVACTNCTDPKDEGKKRNYEHLNEVN